MMDPAPLTVSAIDDPRIAHYRHVRDRDLTGRGGRFVAEGEVVVRLLLSERSRFQVESLLVAHARLAGLASLLADVPAGMAVYAASREVLDGITGFPIHRGLLAIGLRGEGGAVPLPALGRPALVLVLVGIANHDNVGGAFRNAAAFGADAVLMDGTSCDPLYRKAIRVSVGASLIIPFRRGGTAEELVGGLIKAGFAVFALSPAGRRDIAAVTFPDRTALLVGSEGTGLPETLLASLDTVRIGMARGFDSLNVATATGIALHAVRGGAGTPAGD